MTWVGWSWKAQFIQRSFQGQHGATISCWTGYLDKICVDLHLPSRYGLVLIALKAIFRFKMLLTHLADPNRLASVIAVLQKSTPKAGAHRGNGDTVILSDTPFKSKVYWKLLPTVLHCTNEKTKQAALQALLESKNSYAFADGFPFVFVFSPASKFRAKAKRGSCSWAFTVTSMARKLKGCLVLGPAVNGVVRCMSETGNVSGVRTGFEFVESNMKFWKLPKLILWFATHACSMQLLFFNSFFMIHHSKRKQLIAAKAFPLAPSL